jgi:hypothetical protein
MQCHLVAGATMSVCMFVRRQRRLTKLSATNQPMCRNNLDFECMMMYPCVMAHTACPGIGNDALGVSI